MDKREFSDIRHCLEKTQKQMAQLLGTSTKAIESFEQGWRNIPVHIERQVLFLLAGMTLKNQKRSVCWSIQKCPTKVRKNCPAWEFQTGEFCWFINGTICHGEVQETWQKKMTMCRKCKVFMHKMPRLYD